MVSFSLPSTYPAVSDTELKRIKDAYKRYAGVGNLSIERFITDVLGGFVPNTVASVSFWANIVMLLFGMLGGCPFYILSLSLCIGVI